MAGKMSVIQQTLFNMRISGKQYTVAESDLFNVRSSSLCIQIPAGLFCPVFGKDVGCGTSAIIVRKNPDMSASFCIEQADIRGHLRVVR